MKRTAFFVIAALFVTLAAFAQTRLEIQPPVTVKLMDGKSIQFRLDYLTEDKVSYFYPGGPKTNMDRDRVHWISFDGKDHIGKFDLGQEGAVLKDGTVVNGRVVGMDNENFFIRHAGNQESVLRSKVVFLKITKDKPPEPEPTSPPLPPKLVPQKERQVKVVVPAQQQWTSTGLSVEKGERIWFSVSSNQTITCSAQYPPVNAGGRDPYWYDAGRPMPDEKACTLIARIGDAQPFQVGLRDNAFDADAQGMILLGINDSDLRDNAGEFNVTIRVVMQK